ncbi:MAG: methylenetetrahydrofolate--tRNA-(uracil(54)-C(5))-methyltransferase (FADH(2)-oxidizing) TrmFO, partial [Clostridia bacterium]|nr:methylenetetrahydrofolate--tRNA-(uracil(54)-C(5))-methyltransferase (FADH(2)-oxidizing) TrmFO [Clostridia bacterium]
RRVLGEDEIVFPPETMIGAMAHYVSRGGTGKFVPMNANFGIVESLGYRVKGGKIAKYTVVAERSLGIIDGIKDKL